VHCLVRHTAPEIAAISWDQVSHKIHLYMASLLVALGLDTAPTEWQMISKG
jgi:hypothetical protein